MRYSYNGLQQFTDILIEDLRKKGVNFNSSRYFKNDLFKELTQEYIDTEIGLTLSWLVERTAVTSELLQEIYGPYMMGVKVEDKEEIYRKNVFLNFFTDSDYRDTYYGDYIVNMPSELDLYFFRQDSNGPSKGIQYELEDWGLNVDDFPDDESKFKLLFLLFMAEHNPDFVKKRKTNSNDSPDLAKRKTNSNDSSDLSKRTNIFKLLNNPTSENADRSKLGIKAANAEIIRFLKSEIIKEIPLKYAYDVRDAFIKITNEWSMLLKNIRIQANKNLSDEEASTHFKNIHNLWHAFFYSCFDEFFKDKCQSDSLLETFYLKLREHEHIGIERDITLGNKLIEKEGEFVINLKLREYLKNHNDIMDEESYIKERRKEYACLIFQSDSITSNQLRTYDTACEAFQGCLKILEHNSAVPFGCITETYFLIAIDEYIKLSKKQKIDNQFYLHASNEPRHLKADIPKGNEAFSINQFAWFSHVEYAIKQYFGKGSAEYITLENDMSLRIQSIYSTNSLSDFLRTHNVLFYLSEKLAHADILPICYEKFNSFLNGYKLVKCELSDIFLLLSFEDDYTALRHGAEAINKIISKLQSELRCAILPLERKIYIPVCNGNHCTTETNAMVLAVNINLLSNEIKIGLLKVIRYD